MTEPMFPESSSDERDIGWGDDLPDRREDDGDRDADDARLRSERPPHHDQP